MPEFGFFTYSEIRRTYECKTIDQALFAFQKDELYNMPDGDIISVRIRDDRSSRRWSYDFKDGQFQRRYYGWRQWLDLNHFWDERIEHRFGPYSRELYNSRNMAIFRFDSPIQIGQDILTNFTLTEQSHVVEFQVQRPAPMRRRVISWIAEETDCPWSADLRRVDADNMIWQFSFADVSAATKCKLVFG